MVAIGSVKDLAAQGGTQDEAGIGEAGEFALYGADAGCDLAGDLAGEEGLVGGSEEEGQDLASGLAEEEISEGWGGCTHFEYNCTQNEYVCTGKMRCRVTKAILSSHAPSVGGWCIRCRLPPPSAYRSVRLRSPHRFEHRNT